MDVAVAVKKNSRTYEVYLLLGSNLPLNQGGKVLQPKEILSYAINRIKTIFISDASVSCPLSLGSVTFSKSFCCTKVLKTKPLGMFNSSKVPDFYNQVVVFRTTLSPSKVLSACQSIEKELGRKRSAKELKAGDDKKRERVYASRSIDIDILKVYKVRLCANENNVSSKEMCVRVAKTETLIPVIRTTPHLQLPHPQIETRPFVKKLLKEIRSC